MVLRHESAQRRGQPEWAGPQRCGDAGQCARQASFTESVARQRQRVYGDSAYASQKELIASETPKARDFTNQRTRYKGFIDEVVRAKNRNKSRIRSRVEHVFGVVKRLWGFGKVRYRGLQKNATRAFTALALANIYLGRQSLLAQVRP